MQMFLSCAPGETGVQRKKGTAAKAVSFVRKSPPDPVPMVVGRSELAWNLRAPCGFGSKSALIVGAGGGLLLESGQ